MKILVVSDNHMNDFVLENVLNLHQDCDLYIHCGDSEATMDSLKPFACVKGNNDYDPAFPRNRVIDTPKHSFFVTHGHYEWCDYEKMGISAKATGCDVVLYGHTHRFDDTEIEGIRFINPGSLSHNRDHTPPCYAIIEIDDNTGEMTVNRVNVG